jgi:hypothetical protein
MTQLAALLRRLGVWREAGRSVTWPTGATPLGLVAGDDEAARLHRRAVAAAGSADAADETVAMWAVLPPAERAAVVDLTRMAGANRQIDGTACGSAVLTMLAGTGDPTLALWLVTGRLGTHVPPELDAASPGALAALAGASAERRFAAIQRVVKHRSVRRALFGLPWPGGLGTPPWGAARVARFPGVVFDHHPLDDADRAHLGDVLDGVWRAVDAGVPVPLYSGGDTARGWRTAVPRHVVLAVGHDGDRLTVFEPSSGRLVAVPRTALLAGQVPQVALGGWPHLVWILAPRPV